MQGEKNREREENRGERPVSRMAEAGGQWSKSQRAEAGGQKPEASEKGSKLANQRAETGRTRGQLDTGRGTGKQTLMGFLISKKINNGK